MSSRWSAFYGGPMHGRAIKTDGRYIYLAPLPTKPQTLRIPEEDIRATGPTFEVINYYRDIFGNYNVNPEPTWEELHTSRSDRIWLEYSTAAT